MDTFKIIAVTSLVLIGLLYATTVAAEPRTWVRSSIAEFRECVANQNKVPVEYFRVFWDVQTATCYVTLDNGKTMTWKKLIGTIV